MISAVCCGTIRTVRTSDDDREDDEQCDDDESDDAAVHGISLLSLAPGPVRPGMDAVV